jgi:hypothetical protein
MKAIVDAHAAGHKVAIHWAGLPGVADAVRAGADSVGTESIWTTTIAEISHGTVWGADDRSQSVRGRCGRYGFKPEAIPPPRSTFEEPGVGARRGQSRRQDRNGSDAVYSMFGQNTASSAGWSRPA